MVPYHLEEAMSVGTSLQAKNQIGICRLFRNSERVRRTKVRSSIAMSAGGPFDGKYSKVGFELSALLMNPETG